MNNKTKLAGLVMVCVALVGCSSFINNVKNTSLATTKAVYTGYVGWTNYYNYATNTMTGDDPKLVELEHTRLALKAARLDFAASVGVLDTWVAAYETNALDKTQVQAALDGTLRSGSNFVWLINYVKSNSQHP